MRKLILIAAMAAFVAAPAQAADWQSTAGGVGASAFVGARVRIPLGASSAAKPQASLTIAPMQSYRSAGGRAVTRIGEGVALDFADRTPTLKLGGVPAGAALGLHEQGNVAPGRGLGVSTTAWVAIGAVVLLGTALVVTQLTCVGRDKDFCGSD